MPWLRTPPYTPPEKLDPRRRLSSSLPPIAPPAWISSLWDGSQWRHRSKIPPPPPVEPRKGGETTTQISCRIQWQMVPWRGSRQQMAAISGGNTIPSLLHPPCIRLHAFGVQTGAHLAREVHTPSPSLLTLTGFFLQLCREPTHGSDEVGAGFTLGMERCKAE